MKEEVERILTHKAHGAAIPTILLWNEGSCYNLKLKQHNGFSELFSPHNRPTETSRKYHPGPTTHTTVTLLTFKLHQTQINWETSCMPSKVLRCPRHCNLKTHREQLLYVLYTFNITESPLTAANCCGSIFKQSEVSPACDVWPVQLKHLYWHIWEASTEQCSGEKVKISQPLSLLFHSTLKIYIVGTSR